LKQIGGNSLLADNNNSSLLTDVTTQFKNTYEIVDKALLEFEYEGCTSSTVFVWQSGEHRYLQAANTGDSTAFLIRNEKAVQLTIDHKPTLPSERERIIASGIELADNQKRLGGLAVSRALGDHFLKHENLGVSGEPSIGEPIKLEATDSVLIVASDGLWDVTSPEQAAEICKKYNTAEDIARKLLTTAIADMTCTDNVTVVVATL